MIVVFGTVGLAFCYVAIYFFNNCSLPRAPLPFASLSLWNLLYLQYLSLLITHILSLHTKSFTAYLKLAKGPFTFCFVSFVKFVILVTFEITANAHFDLADKILATFAKLPLGCWRGWTTCRSIIAKEAAWTNVWLLPMNLLTWFTDIEFQSDQYSRSSNIAMENGCWTIAPSLRTVWRSVPL